MDLFKKRLEVSDVLDIDYEQQVNNTRDIMRVCFKKCGNFRQPDLSVDEKICLNNCSLMLFNEFIQKHYRSVDKIKTSN